MVSKDKLRGGLRAFDAFTRNPYLNILVGLI